MLLPKFFWGCLTGIALFILPYSSSSQVQAQPLDKQSNSPDDGVFKVGYIPVKNPDLKPLEEITQESKLFEAIANELNKIFVLPTDIGIVLAECGQANAFYTSEHRAIVVCYELMVDFARFSSQYATSDQDIAQGMLGGTMYVFLHELGHALIDVLNLPTVGREEDAVDQLATLVSVQAGDLADEMTIIPALQYMVRSQETGTQNLPYWGEHSLDLQRYYNIMCLLYGSNPSKYSAIATLAQLPGERAITTMDVAIAAAKNDANQTSSRNSSIKRQQQQSQ